MTISIVPILVCIVGLLLFAFAPQAKAQRIGEHMFWVGLLTALLAGGGHAISIK